MAYGIYFLDQGSNLGPLHWEHRVLTTGPPVELWKFLQYTLYLPFPSFLSPLPLPFLLLSSRESLSKPFLDPCLGHSPLLLHLQHPSSSSKIQIKCHPWLKHRLIYPGILNHTSFPSSCKNNTTFISFCLSFKC